jgi:hypothetical protein
MEVFIHGRVHSWMGPQAKANSGMPERGSDISVRIIGDCRPSRNAHKDEMALVRKVDKMPVRRWTTLVS